MLVDFDTCTIHLDLFPVDELVVENKHVVSFSHTLVGRSNVIEAFKFYTFGMEIAHEPFFDGSETPLNVMEKIEKQRLKVNGENYIDDFGFYVYYRIIEGNKLKDLRYD